MDIKDTSRFVAVLYYIVSTAVFVCYRPMSSMLLRAGSECLMATTLPAFASEEELSRARTAYDTVSVSLRRLSSLSPANMHPVGRPTF